MYCISFVTMLYYAANTFKINVLLAVYCSEVGKDAESRLFADGKTPVPIWEPHLCVLYCDAKRLSHFRTEKVIA